MEWLLIPGLIVIPALLVIILDVVTTKKLEGFYEGCLLVLAALFIVAIILCPCIYYNTRTDALRAEAYYQYMALPHMVEEYDEHIVVENLEAGIWQAGEMNIATYNAYLKSMKWWDSIPVIGTTIYGPPGHLKYVEVQ